MSKCIVPCREAAGAAEMRMGVVEAGIVDGYFDALAVKGAADRIPGRGCADEGHAVLMVVLTHSHRKNFHHTGQLCQRGKLVARDADLEAVQAVLESEQNFRAQALDAGPN